MQIPLLALVVAGSAAVWWLVWPVLGVVAAAVFTAAVVGFVLRFLGGAWRCYTTDHVDGPAKVPVPPATRPGFARYLTRQVWRDLFTVVTDTVTAAAPPAMLLGAGATQLLMVGWRAIPLAPIWLAVVAGMLAGAAGCVVIAALVAAGYAVVAGLANGVQLLGIGVLRGVDGLLVSVRRTRPACPHPGCYQAFRRPEYACPRCDARHHHLVPGRYGVLRRVCRCGTRLPTAALWGRGRLAAYCPHCHQPLTGGIGESPLVQVPIVGGPGAGKTTYAHLAIGALGGRVRFADHDEAAGFKGRIAALRDGERVPRTPDELPRATVLDLTLDDDRRCLLYVFDPPGEHYTATDRIAWQRYLDLATGLLLIVDPLSLEGVRRSLSPTERKALSDVTSSSEDPAHVIDRLVGALRTRPDGGRLERVAVVVTKTDAMRRTAVGEKLAHGPDPDGPSTDQVRDWLDSVGWGNPMRTLDRTAADVRYFVSGLHLPDTRLAEPVRWLATGSLAGRRVRPIPELAAAGPLPGSLTAEQIPVHYRVFRRVLLGTIWLCTVAGVAGLFSALAIATWNLLPH